MTPITAHRRGLGGTPPRAAGAASPLRIGMIAPPWVPVPPPAYGGIENVVAGLTRELADRGHEVALVAAPGSALPGADVIEVLDRVPDAFGHVEADLAHGLGAYDALRDADVIVDHTGPSGALLSAWSGMPVLYVCHNRIDALRIEGIAFPTGVLGVEVERSGATRVLSAPEGIAVEIVPAG